LSSVQWSACAVLAVGFGFACSSQTPPAQAPEASTPPPAAAPAEQPATDKAAPGPIVVKDVGFMTPESVQYEPTGDVYLVSNINGGPLDKDDNGFISKLSPEGKVLELKWIDGGSKDVDLNAPKGFGISAGKLFVADIDVIRTFDLATGKPLAQIKVPGASFLNDVTVAADGTVYVSDTGLKAGKEGLEPAKKDAIYKVSSDGKLSTLIMASSCRSRTGCSRTLRACGSPPGRASSITSPPTASRRPRSARPAGSSTGCCARRTVRRSSAAGRSRWCTWARQTASSRR